MPPACGRLACRHASRSASICKASRGGPAGLGGCDLTCAKSGRDPDGLPAAPCAPRAPARPSAGAGGARCRGRWPPHAPLSPRAQGPAQRRLRGRDGRGRDRRDRRARLCPLARPRRLFGRSRRGARTRRAATARARRSGGVRRGARPPARLSAVVRVGRRRRRRAARDPPGARLPERGDARDRAGWRRAAVMATEAHGLVRPLIAERLRALLAGLAHGSEASQLVVFARVLLRSGGYLEGLPDEDAAAMVASAFRFFAAPGPDLRVRAITATYASEGWDAPGPGIETCIPDRPFVVDTVRGRLHAAGVEIRALLHPILTVRRDPGGRLEFVAPPEEPGAHDSFLHIVTAPVADPGVLRQLEESIRAALEDVRLATDDFAAMVARAHALAAELEAGARTHPAQIAAEATAVADLLRWLVDGGFVFLGYREYGLAGGNLVARQGTSLGLLRRDEYGVDGPATVDGRLLVVAKALAESPVHRRACMDDLTVRELDAAGRVTGARRFMGLFTSKAYAEEAAEIPLLRRSLRQVLAAEQVVPGSHDYKEIVAIFNALPKPALFAGTPADIREQIRTIMEASRTDDVVVAVRPSGPAGRVVVLVVLPRDRFSSDAQERVREATLAHFGGRVVDEHLVLGDHERVLLHLTIAPGGAPPEDTEPFEAVVRTIVRTWEEGLRDVLLARHGDDEGSRLAATFAGAF